MRTIIGFLGTVLQIVVIALVSAKIIDLFDPEEDQEEEEE